MRDEFVERSELTRYFIKRYRDEVDPEVKKFLSAIVLLSESVDEMYSEFKEKKK